MQNDVTIDGNKISTWYAEHMEEKPYHAVNMTVAVEKLIDYDLTEEEKASMPHLMAGYCRLIEEANLVGYGDTEFEAIQDLFSNAIRTDL